MRRAQTHLARGGAVLGQLPTTRAESSAVSAFCPPSSRQSFACPEQGHGRGGSNATHLAVCALLELAARRRRSAHGARHPRPPAPPAAPPLSPSASHELYRRSWLADGLQQSRAGAGGIAWVLPVRSRRRLRRTGWPDTAGRNLSGCARRSATIWC